MTPLSPTGRYIAPPEFKQLEGTAPITKAEQIPVSPLVGCDFAEIERRVMSDMEAATGVAHVLSRF